MKALVALVALFLCPIPGGYAKKADSAVAIRAIAPTEPLRAGGSATMALQLTIASPYHINAHQPLQEYLIPTSLELEAIPGITFGKPVFPPAEVKKLPVSDSPMAVYEGVVTITTEMRLAADFPATRAVVRGRVRTQACDNISCLPPRWNAFQLTIPIAEALPAAASLPSRNAPPADNGTPGAGLAAEGPDAESKADFGSRNLPGMLLLVFLGGLALNLTPCVYPMIPITITYFGGQAQGRKGSLLAHAAAYVLGMAITYSALGVAAAMTGGLFGAALQYPPVLIGIALIMVLLALSMFDVYELRMPSFMNRLAESSRAGVSGTLLMGLTVGIVAAPCIGPFVLGLLTYVGNQRSVGLGFLLFFTLALGLGLPFLLLGIFSGSLHRLPRSGAWMVWVRRAFGFVLLALALYFVRDLLPNALVYPLALAVLLLLAGVYLAWIDPVSVAGKVFPCVRNLVGAILFAAAVYCAAAGIQASIESSRLSAGQPARSAGIQWAPYADSMLARAARERKPVFIDFFADWCAPCKELDRKTFAAPEVVRLSERFVMLKVDLTVAGDPETEALRAKFQVRGVPTLVFLKPDGRELSALRGTGFETREVFVDKMNRALREIGASMPVR